MIANTLFFLWKPLNYNCFELFTHLYVYFFIFSKYVCFQCFSLRIQFVSGSVCFNPGKWFFRVKKLRIISEEIIDYASKVFSSEFHLYSRWRDSILFVFSQLSWLLKIDNQTQNSNGKNFLPCLEISFSINYGQFLKFKGGLWMA